MPATKFRNKTALKHKTEITTALEKPKSAIVSLGCVALCFCI